MTRRLTLPMTCVLGLLLPAAAQESRWESAIQAFEKGDRESPPPRGEIVFVGSSTIRMWKLEESFSGLKVINRGFGGSQVADSARFADRIITPYKPRIVVVYAGGNDLEAGKTPEQVLSDFRELAGKVHAALPRTRVAYISIRSTTKRLGRDPQVRRVNELIREHAGKDERLRFIDVDSKMRGPDGQPRADLELADGVHLNADGYKLLNSLVEPVLKELDRATRP